MTRRFKLACGLAVGVVGLSWLAPGCGDTTNAFPTGGDAAAGATYFPDSSACVPLSTCATSTCPPSPDGGFPCYWTCGQARLCADAHFESSASSCSSSGCSGSIDAAVSYTVNATNVRCVLTAMRDGATGEISWGTGSTGAIPTSYQEDWNLISGRQGYGWWQYESDSYDYGRTAGKQLKPASYFDTCLSSNDVNTWLTCLQDAFVTCP